MEYLIKTECTIADPAMFSKYGVLDDFTKFSVIFDQVMQKNGFSKNDISDIVIYAVFAYWKHHSFQYGSPVNIRYNLKTNSGKVVPNSNGWIDLYVERNSHGKAVAYYGDGKEIETDAWGKYKNKPKEIYGDTEVVFKSISKAILKDLEGKGLILSREKAVA